MRLLLFEIIYSEDHKRVTNGVSSSAMTCDYLAIYEYFLIVTSVVGFKRTLDAFVGRCSTQLCFYRTISLNKHHIFDLRVFGIITDYDHKYVLLSNSRTIMAKDEK